MPASCPFCEISRNENHAATILRDDLVIAFMDHRPIRPGHVLIVPREHEPDFFALSEPLIARMMTIAKQLAIALQDVFQPLRVGMVVAGLDVPHAHVHLIPMQDYHDVTSRRLLEGQLAHAPPSELADLAHAIRQAIPH